MEKIELFKFTERFKKKMFKTELCPKSIDHFVLVACLLSLSVAALVENICFLIEYLTIYDFRRVVLFINLLIEKLIFIFWKCGGICVGVRLF